MSSLTLHLFGPLRILIEAKCLLRARTRSVEWLLALLTLRQGRAVDRTWLAGTLWPESDESQALHNLRNALMHLRKAIGPESARLQSPTRSTLLLDLEGVDADVVRFDAAIKRGDVDSLREAVALHTGPLLEGCYETWVIQERESREQACLTALETLAGWAAEQGNHAEVIRYLRQARALDPLRDSVIRQMMVSLAATGDPGAAVEIYREFRNRLHAELAAAPDAETFRLFQKIREQARQPAGITKIRHSDVFSQIQNPPHGIKSAHAAPYRFPHALAPLIGREEEMQEIKSRLTQSRLVTLIGAGGVGKTRLAMEIASHAEPEFKGGVLWVELAPLSEDALILPAIGATLGLRQDGMSDPETLWNALIARFSESAWLLIADNCEHLLDSVAEVLQTLLSRCPQFRVLATSRQRLGVAGEITWRVPSLAAPAPDEPPADMPAALTFPAIRLFAERAASARLGFQLTRQEEVEAVCRICRRLDGIPLALELAAARANVLSVQQIASRLDDRFRLLTAGRRADPPRHQTLRALIDWSYEQLPEAERALLRRMSVFVGGWSLEAAESMGIEPWTVDEQKEDDCTSARRSQHRQPGADVILDVLASLVERSLVLADEHPVGLRYRMLETVQEYEQERLQEGGEEEQARQKHRDYCLMLVESASAQWEATHEKVWLNRLEQEHSDVLAAMDFCEQDEDSYEIGLRFLPAMRAFWSMRGYASEGRRRCKSLLQKGLPVRSRLRADALWTQAHLAHVQCDYAEASSLAEEVIALYRNEGHASGIAAALHFLAGLGPEDSIRCKYLEESLTIYREIQNMQGVATVLNSMGIRAREERDYERARQLFEECLAIHRGVKNTAGIAVTLHSLSYNAFLQADYQSSRALAEESLRLHQELGNTRWVMVNLQHLGWVCLRLRKWEEARVSCKESLRLQKVFWVKQELTTALECLADIAAMEQQWERAACLYGAAGVLIRTYQLVSAEGRSETTQEKVPLLRTALGETAFARAWAKGEAMTMEQAIPFALSEVSS